jgi:hypothetical protein
VSDDVGDETDQKSFEGGCHENVLKHTLTEYLGIRR